jgi:ribosomal protein S27AE
MTEIQPASRERYSIRETNQRHCPKCKAGMDLAQSVPGLGHLAHRIFECGKCGHVLIAPQ